MPDLLRLQRSVKDAALVVGEPLLQNLVAAQFVAPHRGRYVASVGAVVEVDVAGGGAKEVCHAAQSGTLICGEWMRSVSRQIKIARLTGDIQVRQGEGDSVQLGRLSR